MLQICCISDTHGRHTQLDLRPYKADVLVHAGDWTRGDDLGLLETKDFFDWLILQPFKHKIIIAGNHEVQVEDYPVEFRALLSQYHTITYLQDSSVVVDGIKFYGSPYSNEFYNWAFMSSDDELAKLWERIPLDTNILITHGPAYKCHDKVKNAFGCDPHVGSRSLAKRKKLLRKLDVHISGHIHEAYGKRVHESVLNVCASLLNDSYQLVNAPIIIELNKRINNEK